VEVAEPVTAVAAGAGGCAFVLEEAIRAALSVVIEAAMSVRAAFILRTP
jgi:hypothetical protein